MRCTSTPYTHTHPLRERRRPDAYPPRTPDWMYRFYSAWDNFPPLNKAPDFHCPLISGLVFGRYTIGFDIRYPVLFLTIWRYFWASRVRDCSHFFPPGTRAFSSSAGNITSGLGIFFRGLPPGNFLTTKPLGIEPGSKPL